MTTAEAAESLGIAPTTVRRQIEQGRIAARKVGRDWWVTPREVERYRAESLGRPGRKTG
jgi:excisionase family DNA binding protein